MPDFDGPRKMPVHGTSGTTGVRGLFAAVFRHRKQLDLSHPFVSLAKFEAGKPGGESGSASLCTDALPEFSGIKPKGWYAAEVLWK